MNAQEALAQALHECGEVYADCRRREDEDDVAAGLSLVRVYRDCGPKWHMEKAAAILDALRESGHGVYPSDDYRTSVEIIADNAAKAERKRLRAAALKLPRWDEITLSQVKALLADPEDNEPNVKHR